MIQRCVILVLSLTVFLSCKDSTTTATAVEAESDSPAPDPRSAPSANLPASEIMRTQVITTIHFTDYYHLTTNGQADTGFSAWHEFHIDTVHRRFGQYFFGTPDWNVTVYDLKKGIAWNFYNQTLTYPQLPDLRRAYEGNVQRRLGSWLGARQWYVRSEYVNDKYCHVFTDSSGTLEWVWQEHRLPIQHRVEGWSSVDHRITYTQWRDLQINAVYRDSLFGPPEQAGS